MVAVFNVDAYAFLALTELTCHLEDTGMVFSDFTVLPDSKETELISSDQEASQSADKKTRVVFVAYLHMEVHPYSYLQWCGFS